MSRVWGQEKEDLLKQIEKFIFKKYKGKEFWVSLVARKFYEEESSKQNYMLLVAYTSELIRNLVKQGKIKFVKEEQKKGRLKAKLYKVV